MSIYVLLRYKSMGVEGWLIDPAGIWSKRFHRDEKSWLRDPRVFVDDGRAMADGSPALLKSRRPVRRDDAEAMWRELRRQGWKQTAPVWGEGAEF